MEKNAKKQTQFLLRLTPGDAIQLEAIACRLGITKSQVLRLSLAPSNAHKNPKSDKEMAALADTLDAIFSRLGALDARLQNVESLMGGAADLLLSMSRAAQQPAPRQAEPVQAEKAQPAAGLKWSDFARKHHKTSPIMSDGEWTEFLKKRYSEQYGFPPDLSA